MDEFDNMWHEGIEVVEETPPEYLQKEGLAKYNILCDLLAFYYHSKHGEPISDIFKPDPDNILFKIK